jgi:hypothetical protein
VTDSESDRVLLIQNIFVQTQNSYILDTQSNVSKRHDFSYFTAVVVISPTVHGSVQITEVDYPLMHYTKLISDEHFTPGRPLVIVLPLAGEASTNKEMGYLTEELYASGRWPILVYNFSYKMDENKYAHIHQDGSYIILISGPCKQWEVHISLLWEKLHELSVGNNTRRS